MRGWFTGDDDWQRPTPPLGVSDWVMAVVALVLSALTVEALKSISADYGTHPVWAQYLVLVTACLALAFRRRFPVVVMLILGVHFYLACTFVPEVGYSFTYQLIPFLGVFSGMAWSRDRRAAALAATGLGIGLTLWLVWLFALGRALSGYPGMASGDGLFSRPVGMILYTAICNGIYFFGAVVLGNVAWQQARDHEATRAQAQTIAQQSDELARAAVLEERLRLARELHDVVAHHVAVTGVQAAGARRVLTKDTDLAAQALATVEQSSRDAVTQMRSLLGTLRSGREGDEGEGRAPQPTLTDVDRLVDEVRSPGFDVTLDVVESVPGAAARVALPVGLTIYRTIQESLANVRRHSNARSAAVVVRVREGEWCEVEVTDDGTPRGNTSGSGFGQQGIRERIASFGGQVDIGPRPDHGYRVRARLPWAAAS